MSKKVTFTLNIGYVGAEHKETFDIEKDLGFIKGKDYDTESELDELLNEAWADWTENYIDGGFRLEDDTP